GCRLVAKKPRECCLCAKGGVEIALALHSVLGNLIETPTHPRRLELDLVLVKLFMAGFTMHHGATSCQGGRAVSPSTGRTDGVFGPARSPPASGRAVGTGRAGSPA